MLHMSKVAVGCGTLDALARRIAARSIGGEAPAITRFRPKRAEELVGGSLFWIAQHRLVARQTILGFGALDGRTIIRLEARLVPVHPLPMRAHQGWRYLADGDVPPDLAEGDPIAALPPPVAAELARLALI